MKEEYRQQIIDMLTKAYWMELETVTNYLANSVDLNGVRAEEIKKSLAEELTHAQSLAKRVKLRRLTGVYRDSRQHKNRFSHLQTPLKSLK